MEIKKWTQKEFLDAMLKNLKNTEDKTPNSFSYDILSATAIVFQWMDTKLEELLKLFDVDSLEDEDLTKRVFQTAGLVRNEATFSTGTIKATGENGTSIPKDTVFKAGEVEFKSLEKTEIINSVAYVKVQCLESGDIGNVVVNSITELKEKIQGVIDITNEKSFTNGYNEESDDDLRERFYEVLQNPPKAGNPAHYKLWATDVDGIWNARVFRTWQGGGTVKIVVIGDDRKEVNKEMIERVKENVINNAPIRYESLTVESATPKDINISIKIKRTSQKELVNLKEDIENQIKKYFYDVTFRENFISYAKVGGEVLKVDGVLDYADLMVNSIKENVKLLETEYPRLSKVEVVEIE